jgi:hypothetical protein
MIFGFPPPAVPPNPMPDDSKGSQWIPERPAEVVGEIVPTEPNGHLLTLHRKQTEERDRTYRAMRSTADEINRRLTREDNRQADLDRIRREAPDSGDAA